MQTGKRGLLLTPILVVKMNALGFTYERVDATDELIITGDVHDHAALDVEL